MRRTPGLIATAAIALALSGCVSAGSTTAAAGAPSASPSSEPSAAASAAPCTTRACIIEDAKGALVGGVAKNESVMTRLSCVKSTVKNPDPGVWTVRCTADYSNGMVAKGVANVLLKSDQVTWSPTDIISYGS